VQNLPAGRLFQINTSDDAAQARFWTWGSAWKGFLERPILGWGPENFSAVFDKYFDTRHFVPSRQTETWFDRAHSVFLDYLSEIGILGLLSYLAIFGVIIWEFFRKHRQSEARSTSRTILTRGLILSLLVAYLVQGVVIFDVLPMYISLFLFLAFAYYYFYSQPHEA
jgi:O-antigen ligase